MKRILLFLFILLSLSQARASGALTIGQVYNFNVGDTFDYKQVVADYSYAPPLITTTYTRYIIMGKMLFTDTVEYIMKYTYPSLGFDTVVYNDINSSIFGITDYSFYMPYYASGSDSVNSTGFSTWDSAYNGIILTSRFPYTAQYYQFENGLGRTIYAFGVGYYSDQGLYILQYIVGDSLIYYSKGDTHEGTPYYSYTTDINYIAYISNIKLYPNPTNDLLHLSISNASQYNTQLIITDLLGQEVYSSPVTQSETTHDISKLVPGIYTWRVVEDNSIIKTGKVIKE